MSAALIEAREGATRRFLGRGELVGVAIKGPRGPLLMLMRRPSEREQAEIAELGAFQ